MRSIILENDDISLGNQLLEEKKFVKYSISIWILEFVDLIF